MEQHLGEMRYLFFVFFCRESDEKMDATLASVCHDAAAGEWISWNAGSAKRKTLIFAQRVDKSRNEGKWTVLSQGKHN